MTTAIRMAKAKTGQRFATSRSVIWERIPAFARTHNASQCGNRGQPSSRFGPSERALSTVSVSRCIEQTKAAATVGLPKTSWPHISVASSIATLLLGGCVGSDGWQFPIGQFRNERDHSPCGGRVWNALDCGLLLKKLASDPKRDWIGVCSRRMDMPTERDSLPIVYYVRS
jgi:hypothetical protein